MRHDSFVIGAGGTLRMISLGITCFLRVRAVRSGGDVIFGGVGSARVRRVSQVDGHQESSAGGIIARGPVRVLRSVAR